MTTAHGHRIDWRAQFDALAPYIHGKPGVVHIGTSKGSPTSAFIRVLRHTLVSLDAARPWLTVQLDPDNSNTHYFEDIVQQISHSVESPLDLISPPTGHVTIAENLEAGGNIDIHNVTVAGRRLFSDDQLGAALAESLTRRLTTHRVALIVNESHRYPRRQLDSLWSRLWEGRLASLVDKGLLLIDVAIPEKRNPRSSWPPVAQIMIDLPTHLGESERAAAVEDLCAIALGSGMYAAEDHARVFAETLLTSSNSVRDLHARVGLTMVGR